MKIDSLASSTSNLMFGTAVAGFGYSLGRGGFKGLKNILPVFFAIFILFGAILFPFVSMSQISRWYPMGMLKWFFLKFLVWGMVSAIGFSLIALIVFMLSQDAIVMTEMKNLLSSTPLSDLKFENKIVIGCSVLIWSILSLFGFIDGYRIRNKRKQAHQLELDNQRFLDDCGIREVEGADSFTHVDSVGEKLKFISTGKDAAEFRVVGRRNKRAFIFIDKNGKFTQYSGVVSL
jgi:hypothetical protein